MGFVEELVARRRRRVVPVRRLPRGLGPGGAVHGARSRSTRCRAPASRPRRPRTPRSCRSCSSGRARALRGEGGGGHAQVMRELERVVLLNITDTKWREHLYEMDYLQEGIHLRALAQQDPITEYRREAYDMFQALTDVDPVRLRALHLPGRVRAAGRAAGPPAGSPANPGAATIASEVEQAGGQRSARRRHEGPRTAHPGGQRQGAAERAVPVRQRQEVQEVPRRGSVTRPRCRAVIRRP